MVTRIESALKDPKTDSRGFGAIKRIREDLKINSVSAVRTISVYTIEGSLSKKEKELLSSKLFCDPVIEKYSFSSPLASELDFSFAIEVGFLPGVTDNAGTSSREACEDILGRKLEGAVYTSTQYLLAGSLSQEEAGTIAKKLLSNRLIERTTIISRENWDSKKGFPITLPKVSLAHTPKVSEISLELPDSGLASISNSRCLALSLVEMKLIRSHYSHPRVQEMRKKYGLPKNPTDVEIEALAQTWSEHCKHKIFNAKINYIGEDGKTEAIDSLFTTYIRGSTKEVSKKIKWLVSVFSDNAGIIKFNSDYNAVFKVETHNTPSALDPYGGALTGIVGVNRDVLGAGLGARFIFNTDVFCFAMPDFSGELPAGVLHPKRIFEGVRKGVEHGGNKTGVPTINGCIVFDARYLGRPLVYCGTGGLIPAKINGKKSEEKEIKEGYLAVMVGGRIGKDGIHGATFSSIQLDLHAPATAVQIGDPITQRKMYDFLLEARDAGLYSAITDNGAGGLSSSIGELAAISGGCEIDLEKAPLKYAGLDPWEILISEAQERMTVVIPPEKITEFLALSKSRSVESTVVGKFTGSGFFQAKYSGKIVCMLPLGFMHNGLPQMELEAEWNETKKPEPSFPCPNSLLPPLISLLSSYNICSKEYVIRQYDHEVGGGSCVKPLTGAENDGPSDAGVIRPILDSREGLVVSNGICPRYSDIDPYWMAACAFDEAVRNAVATGADPARIAILDNFCWPDPVQSEKTPDGKQKLGALVRACKALYHCAVSYGIPCISGKDSMKNDFWAGKRKISILPTLLFSAIGHIPDVGKAVTMDFKHAGDSIYLLGNTRDELGASEYFSLKGFTGNRVPKVDAKKSAGSYSKLHSAIMAGLVSSAHDCSDGGLGAALAESAFAGNIGAEIDLRKVNYSGEKRDDFVLFSESAGRILITAKSESEPEFEKLMQGCEISRIGKTIAGQELRITGLAGKPVLKSGLQKLKAAWKKTLDW